MEDIIWNLLSILVGSLVTWLVAWRYYVMVAKDLTLETEKTRKLLAISLHALENAGMVKLNRDESGQITGMIHELKIDSGFQAQTSDNITLEVENKLHKE